MLVGIAITLFVCAAILVVMLLSVRITSARILRAATRAGDARVAVGPLIFDRVGLTRALLKYGDRQTAMLVAATRTAIGDQAVPDALAATLIGASGTAARIVVEDSPLIGFRCPRCGEQQVALLKLQAFPRPDLVDAPNPEGAMGLEFRFMCAACEGTVSPASAYLVRVRAQSHHKGVTT